MTMAFGGELIGVAKSAEICGEGDAKQQGLAKAVFLRDARKDGADGAEHDAQAAVLLIHTPMSEVASIIEQQYARRCAACALQNDTGQMPVEARALDAGAEHEAAEKEQRNVRKKGVGRRVPEPLCVWLSTGAEHQLEPQNHKARYEQGQPPWSHSEQPRRYDAERDLGSAREPQAAVQETHVAQLP